MKRRLLCAALALALAAGLTGCGSKLEPELPEPSNLRSFSVSAEVTEGAPPSQSWVLPTEQTQFSLWPGKEIALLAETEDGSAAVYALPDENMNGDVGVLVRWGDVLAEFPWAYATPRCIPPQVWLRDMDGDGAEELAVSCYVGSGTGVSVEALHVVEQKDGALTDWAVPQTVFDTLTAQLRVVELHGRTYAMLGPELVDVTDQLPQEDVTPTGLHFGDVVSFAPAAGMVGMTVNAEGWLEGEGLVATACYAANVHALVLCKDGQIVIDEMHLDGYGY